jgi:transposase-like protein
VLEGLKGRPIGEVCAEHEISQGQYCQWRDQFLAHAAKAFEPAGAPHRQGRLERENARLKTLVGELALKLTKARRCSGESRSLCQGCRAQRRAARAYPGPQGRAPVRGYRGIWAYLRSVDSLVVNHMA